MRLLGKMITDPATAIAYVLDTLEKVIADTAGPRSLTVRLNPGEWHTREVAAAVRSAFESHYIKYRVVHRAVNKSDGLIRAYIFDYKLEQNFDVQEERDI